MTLRLAAALAVPVAVLASCSSKKHKAATQPEPNAMVRGEAAPGMAPLTGTKANVANRPALFVKVGNSPGARPQSGLDRADVVIEEAVEGGLTRLAAVFQSQDAPSVGPVRSLRQTDTALLDLFGQPVVAHSGAVPDVLAALYASAGLDLGRQARPGLYQARAERPAPDNLFVGTEKLRAAVRSARRTLTLFDYSARSPAGVPASSVTLRFGTVVEYRWDAACGCHLRSQDGRPHVDDHGRQLRATNVVVLFTGYTTAAGVVDAAGAPVLTTSVVGRGQAWVFRNGQRVEATWTRSSSREALRVTTADSRPVALAPGTTWVELAPLGSARTA
ncbi:MAG TPA: DUF3048 domain-containing protein [Acidimicrobiales bacterium]|jgi:hypothetical protein|nr:DUF3048 domain-containing protein [Acidimicrobiales bacterium]